MDYVFLESMVEKLEYEERVRWLQSLYGTKSEHPGRITQLMNRLLFMLGRFLESVGQRMQAHQNQQASSPEMKQANEALHQH